MSRSYKHTPYCGDKKGKSKKRAAWKIVRQWCKDHPEEALQGNEYKRLYDSWDICDYGWITSWQNYWASCLKWHAEAKIRGYGRKLKEPNIKEEYRYWYKHYKSK